MISAFACPVAMISSIFGYQHIVICVLPVVAAGVTARVKRSGYRLISDYASPPFCFEGKGNAPPTLGVGSSDM